MVKKRAEASIPRLIGMTPEMSGPSNEKTAASSHIP
jgi:hypothetical protein